MPLSDGHSEGGSGPREVPTGVEREEVLLESLAGVPMVSQAWCLPRPSGGAELKVKCGQRHLPANKMRSFVFSAAIPAGYEPGVALEWSWPVESSDVLMHSFSPSGKRMVAVKAGPTDADAAVLELWGAGRLLRAVVVPKALHGGVINDGYFAAGMAWSPDESRVAYTAEAPPAVKSKEFGAKVSTEGGKEAPTAAPQTWRGLGPWEEDWGEKNVGKRPPRVFVLEVGSGTVTPVAGLAEDISYGQPVWQPDGGGLVLVGWPHAAENFPQSAARLGVVYCYNRPCHLWAVELGMGALPPRCLTEGQGSAQSPRFSPDGGTLVYLSWAEAVKTGVHNSTVALMALEWPECTAAPREIVPAVRRPKEEGGFPGLYAGFGSTLIDHPFIDNDTLLVGTQWRSMMAVAAVSLSSGAVRCLTPLDGDRPSFSLLATHGRLVVAAASGPCAPPQVMVAQVGEEPSCGPLAWSALPFTAEPEAALGPAVSDALAGLAHHIMPVIPTTGDPDSRIPFEAIVIRPRGAVPGPTVLMPHGGPHHAYPAAYFLPFAFLAATGYTVILVNFRGSTGFGEDCVQSLPGNAGTYDVADCMDALDEAVSMEYADPNQVAVCGGSHGGFLTGHLVGQHPEAFRAGILRNPVLDLGLMVFCTDIPDWTYVEAWGGQAGIQKFKPRPDAQDLERFYEVSPIRYVEAVKAPLLFMLGAQDMRVPWNDAKHYISTLKSRKGAPPVATWLFPEDSHALDRPQTEFEQWLNTAAWLKEHMP
eukprot:jgi/Tetstr1/426001/TSEL_016349.t1